MNAREKMRQRVVFMRNTMSYAQRAALSVDALAGEFNDHLNAIDALIADTSSEGAEAVAFSVALADGSISPFGWMDMRMFDTVKKMAVLGDGAHYIFAHRSAP